jgi:copper chaperone CopZ
MKAKSIVLIIIAIFMITIVSAQDPEPKVKEIKIQTSAVCGMCEERLESNIAFEKGVKSVELDDKTKILTVTYKPDKTDPDKLRKAVSKLGYDADDVEADPEAYKKLPACCKKDVDPH